MQTLTLPARTYVYFIFFWPYRKMKNHFERRRRSFYTGGSETRFAAMCALSWSNFATSCSRPMKLLHYVSQAPHTNICNSIMHKDLQNAAISLNESNSWRRLTTKDHIWLQTWFQTPLWGDSKVILNDSPFNFELRQVTGDQTPWHKYSQLSTGTKKL